MHGRSNAWSALSVTSDCLASLRFLRSDNGHLKNKVYQNYILQLVPGCSITFTYYNFDPVSGGAGTEFYGISGVNLMEIGISPKDTTQLYQVYIPYPQFYEEHGHMSGIH